MSNWWKSKDGHRAINLDKVNIYWFRDDPIYGPELSFGLFTLRQDEALEVFELIKNKH